MGREALPRARPGDCAAMMACVKYLALNWVENSRFNVDVVVGEHALHEVYLPHLTTIVDAGAIR
jgi:beta-glucosidase